MVKPRSAVAIGTLVLASLTLSACYDRGGPRSPGDRPHHHHGHDRDGYRDGR